MTPNEDRRNAIIDYAVELDKERWEELTTSPEAQTLRAILQSYGEMKKGRLRIQTTANQINFDLPQKEYWSNRYVSSMCQRLGFRKCILHGRTAIRWNRELIERLKDDPRYAACFGQAPISSQNRSPISQSHLNQHKGWVKKVLKPEQDSKNRENT